MVRLENILNLKGVVSIVAGSTLQWYDFALFGSLAPIIGRTFFPHQNFTHSLINTYLVFFVSFLLVPVGAVFFGYIGDRYGRKIALKCSIIFMTIPTIIIGITPSYSAIGVYASILIILSRLIQGFTASPEFSSSAIYLVEMAPVKKRSFYGCLTGSAYSVGFTLGGYVAAYFVAWQLPWAWRIPFLLSVVGAVIVLYIRNQLPDSVHKDPLCKILSIPNLATIKECIPVFGLASMQGVFAYGGYVWMITYIFMQHRLTLSKSILVVSIAMLFDAVIEPFIAMVADKTGRKKIAFIGVVGFGIWIYPCIYLVARSGFYGVLCSMLILSFFIAITCCSLNALSVMHFDAKSRCRRFSITFNTAVSIFGGSAPVLLMALANVNLISGYFIFSCVIGSICLRKVKNES